MFPKVKDSTTSDGYELQFGTNVLGEKCLSLPPHPFPKHKPALCEVELTELTLFIPVEALSYSPKPCLPCLSRPPRMSLKVECCDVRGRGDRQVRGPSGSRILTTICSHSSKSRVSLQGMAAKVILEIKDAAMDDSLEHFVFDVTWLTVLGDGVAEPMSSSFCYPHFK
jgi:hypothetical protein